MTSQLTPQVKNTTWYQTKILSNVPQVTLNNFTPYKYFVKFKSSCPKRRLRGKISETEQNYVTNDVIDQKQDIPS